MCSLTRLRDTISHHEKHSRLHLRARRHFREVIHPFIARSTHTIRQHHVKQNRSNPTKTCNAALPSIPTTKSVKHQESPLLSEAVTLLGTGRVDRLMHHHKKQRFISEDTRTAWTTMTDRGRPRKEENKPPASSSSSATHSRQATWWLIINIAFGDRTITINFPT